MLAPLFSDAPLQPLPMRRVIVPAVASRRRRPGVMVARVGREVRRVLVVAALCAVALAVVGSLLPDRGALSGRMAPAASSAPTCQEDQACWQCSIMGNRTCGRVALPADVRELDTTSAAVARTLAAVYPSADVYLVRRLPSVGVVWRVPDAVGIR